MKHIDHRSGPQGGPIGGWGPRFDFCLRLCLLFVFRLLLLIPVFLFAGHIRASYSSYEDDIKTSRIAIPSSTIWQGQSIKISRLR